MSSTTSRPSGRSAAIVRSRPAHLPPWASANIKSKVPVSRSVSSASPFRRFTNCGQSPPGSQVRCLRVLFNGGHGDVCPGQQLPSNPGGTYPCARTEFQHAGTCRQVRGQNGQQLPTAGSQESPNPAERARLVAAATSACKLPSMTASTWQPIPQPSYAAMRYRRQMSVSADWVRRVRLLDSGRGVGSRHSAGWALNGWVSLVIGRVLRFCGWWC
jgi:hypothetical protein